MAKDTTLARGVATRRELSFLSLLLIVPTLIILTFYQNLSGLGFATPEEYDLPSRHLSAEDNPYVYTAEDYDRPSRYLSVEDNPYVYHATPNISGPAVHGSVPDSARRARPLPNLARQVKDKVKNRDQRRQRNRSNLPRRGSRRDVTAWIRHPENITSFSYIPIGRHINATATQNKIVDHLNNTKASSPYAYTFVMGGVNENDGHYLGMLYNVLIAAYILKKEGSIADVVLFVQMSALSNNTYLPDDNVRLLKEVGVQIRYLPKPQVENFHQIIMQKMVVLDLVEYRRVLFLDTDVMPFCNLDYVFHMSDGPKPVLKKNVIIALSGSPANAGYFMLSPKPGDLEKLQEIVRVQQEKAKDLPYPHFDENRGWGHVIRAPDMWWTINKKYKRRRWKFVGSHADQGLLYHWVKYVKRSVSIISGVEVDNYGPKKSREKIRLERTLKNPFKHHTCLPLKYEETFAELTTRDARGMAPYRDFIHFLGGNKPWKKRLPPPVHTNIEADTPYQYWFHMLRLLNIELKMGIDFENWERIKKTPLGGLPKKDLMKELMESNQTVVASIVSKQ